MRLGRLAGKKARHSGCMIRVPGLASPVLVAAWCPVPRYPLRIWPFFHSPNHLRGLLYSLPTTRQPSNHSSRPTTYSPSAQSSTLRLNTYPITHHSLPHHPRAISDHLPNHPPFPASIQSPPYAISPAPSVRVQQSSSCAMID